MKWVGRNVLKITIKQGKKLIQHTCNVKSTSGRFNPPLATTTMHYTLWNGCKMSRVIDGFLVYGYHYAGVDVLEVVEYIERRK